MPSRTNSPPSTVRHTSSCVSNGMYVSPRIPTVTPHPCLAPAGPVQRVKRSEDRPMTASTGLQGLVHRIVILLEDPAKVAWTFPASERAERTRLAASASKGLPTDSASGPRSPDDRHLLPEKGARVRGPALRRSQIFQILEESERSLCPIH